MNWKHITDELPPIGIPLIVTVKDHLQGKANELRYPVYYERTRSNNGYHWSWRYGDVLCFHSQCIFPAAKMTG